MNFFEEVFKRADIQQFREFLLYGTECQALEKEPYVERIEKPLDRLKQRLHELFPNVEDFDDIMNYIFDYSSAVENVFTEVSLLAGIMIANQGSNNS